MIAGSAWVDDKGTVFNQDVLGAIELDYMLDCSEAIVMASLERRESRGAQFRTDYPERDDADWFHFVEVRKGADGRPECFKRPVPPYLYPIDADEREQLTRIFSAIDSYSEQ